ncbi:MAG: CHAT domain-containing protein, partial [Thermoanaerobaculaceae bacterium]|nr:CHAT domain-containing protein [Thermoanaerobaculaceae bacterium]
MSRGLGVGVLLLASVLSGQSLDPACDLLGADCALMRAALAGSHLANASSVAERALTTAERTAGADSLTVAQAIDAVVVLRWNLGRGRELETVALAERAVAIRNRLQGDADPDLIESLHNLGLVLRLTGEFGRASALAAQALAIAEAQVGSGHAVTAHCVVELSASQLAAGDLPAAAASAERGRTAAEEVRPEDRLLLAEALNALGAARYHQRDLEAVVPLFRRALELREVSLAPDHPLVARSALNLGMALRATGGREEGEEMLRRALGIFERAAPNHPDTLHCLNSLALIARSRGEFAQARHLWERALDVGEKVYGEEHPTVAGVLNNLANLRKHMGDYAAAQALLERSLAIRERVRGPEHPEVAQALTNLATVQILRRQYVQAKANAERALTIREKALGPDSAQVGLSLVALGEATLLIGDLDGGRAAYERAVVTLTRAGSGSGADLAAATHGLALVLHHQGNLVEAAAMYQRALAMHEQLLDPQHPQVGEVLAHSGLLAAQRGDLPGAMKMALRAERIGREHLRLTCRSLSEREALTYAGARARGLDLALSLVAVSAEAGDIPGVFGALIRSRTLVLDEAIARSRQLGGAAGGERDNLQREVTEAANELVALLVRGPGREGPDRYRQSLAAARERVEKAERAVAEASPRMGDAGSAATWLQVRAALPTGSVLVAFARYSHQPVTALRAGSSVPSYLAFVLAAGVSGPQVVPLGPASAIDDAVRAWDAEVSRAPSRDPGRAAEAEASYRLAGENLRAAIWDPVAARIGQAQTVFVVPESTLHLVSFDTLPRKGGGYLIEAGPALHQLTAEKDLLLAPRAASRGQGLLAMGGVAFDRRARGGRAPAEPVSLVRAAQDRPTCPEFQSIRFAPLAQTDSEVREVARLFQRTEASATSRRASTVLRGELATEASFRRLAPGKRIVHLATHGFFLGEDCRLAEPSGRGIGGLVSTTEAAPPSPTADIGLRLAGLALAGANQRGTAT